jgi:CCR4-NOT transcription complex subunit 6
MSRSGDDKYENNRSSTANNRRQYRLMSSEEVAAGKKSCWSELEITGIHIFARACVKLVTIVQLFDHVSTMFHVTKGSVRSLSPEIWKLTHLTGLYLNDNHLTRIPADISKLVNLTSLDLSCNKLRSLPQELGELIYLR